MAFPEKITNREYKIAGAFTLFCGSFCLAGSLGFLVPDPGPVALIALSAMPVLFGLISLLTKPIRSVLILGPASLIAFLLAFTVIDLATHGWRNSFLSDGSGGVLLVFLCLSFLSFVRKKVRKNPEADAALETTTDSEPTDPLPPSDERMQKVAQGYAPNKTRKLIGSLVGSAITGAVVGGWVYIRGGDSWLLWAIAAATTVAWLEYQPKK
jgi:hypothetical protein